MDKIEALEILTESLQKRLDAPFYKYVLFYGQSSRHNLSPTDHYTSIKKRITLETGNYCIVVSPTDSATFFEAVMWLVEDGMKAIVITGSTPGVGGFSIPYYAKGITDFINTHFLYVTKNPSKVYKALEVMRKQHDQ